MLYDCTNLSVHVDDLHEFELSEFYSIIILAPLSVLFHAKSKPFFWVNILTCSDPLSALSPSCDI